MAVLEECTSANGDTMIGLQWFRLVGFGGCAEALTAEGVVSGLRVWCEGRLQTRPYADHHGTIRTAIEVVLSDFQVIA
jgi:single-stranded DNA-binding protein